MCKGERNAKKRNRGFTLVELVVGMAIVSIVGSLVVGFLLFSTKHFGNSSEEASLQENSQMLFSQLSSYLIDTNGAVCYYVNPQETGNGTAVLSDARYTGAETDFQSKRLEIYRTSDTDETTVETVIWSERTKELTYSKSKVDSNGNVLSTIDDTQLLADQVETFSVDLTELESSSKVIFSLTLANREKTYQANAVVTLRNKVKVNETVTGAAASVTPTVLSVKVTPSDVTLHKGESQRFSASVRGDNYPSQDVTWSITGNTSSATTIDTNGTLFLAANESASALQVIATAKADTSKSGKAKVTVKAALTYTLVITPDTTTTVKAGKTVDLTAKLVDSDGYEYADASVNWTANNTTVGTFSNQGTNGHSITYQVATGISGKDVVLTAATVKNGVTYSKGVTIHVPALYAFVVQGNTAPSFSGLPEKVDYKGDVVVTDTLLDLKAGIQKMFDALSSSDKKTYLQSTSLWENDWYPGCSSTCSLYFAAPNGNNYIGSNGKILNKMIISEGNLEIGGSIFENGGTASIVYSKNGNITISAAQINFTGIIYAPNGVVTIGNENCTMNGVVISKQLKGGISNNGKISFSRNSEVEAMLKTLAEGN